MSTLVLSSGCLSTVLPFDRPELVDSFTVGMDAELVRGQSSQDAGVPSIFLAYTTDPTEAEKLVAWETMKDKLGEDYPGGNEYYRFEAGVRCLIVIAARLPDGTTIAGFDQSDSDLFETEKVVVERVKETDETKSTYHYAMSLWELNGTDVSSDLSADFEKA